MSQLVTVLTSQKRSTPPSADETGLHGCWLLAARIRLGGGVAILRAQNCGITIPLSTV